MENSGKFTDNHDKNRTDFHSFIKKVINTDKDQEDTELQPND